MTPMTPGATTSARSTAGVTDAGGRPLLDRYDGVVCDLDGVVYRGDGAVPGAPEALSDVVASGRRIVYATNNASRMPSDIADQLRGLGAPCEVDDVVTSAQAGAAHLAERLSPGVRVLAVGGPGTTAAITEAGLTAVAPSDAADHDVTVDAVLQGLGRQLTVTDFEVATRHVARGVPWVASNGDATLPLEWGDAPGNGAYVALVGRAARREPDAVVGKPHPPLYELAADRLGTDRSRTLAVGDRLDTDIDGAGRTGIDSAWVLTGVDAPSDLVRAVSTTPPTYVIGHLGELHQRYVDPVRVDGSDGTWRCGPVTARVQDDALVLEGEDGHPSEAIRAGLALLLERRDAATQAHASPEGEALERLVTLASVLDALVPAATDPSDRATGDTSDRRT
ncbi:HAD superfamily hydrolase (TIGR01450 family) [Terracoccus luteus]|uniref:HAD superfamily hydrolase (TIGR01450 family) n=1 Tax=Terracoccus luteus TaxID=53356 RepID=A0A495XZW0_9MICO|nr:HAD superfamily hydrolase (TIGR01450 family) [Terracoccus luteus]